MSVNPLTLNGMLQRTNEFSTIKQNEDNKPGMEQRVITNHQFKQEQESARKVATMEQKENNGYRYDAKEKGNGSYEENQKKKRNKNEKEKSGDKVVLKGQDSIHFDIKI